MLLQNYLKFIFLIITSQIKILNYAEVIGLQQSNQCLPDRRLVIINNFLVKYISFDFDQLSNLCLERKAVIRTIVQENIDNIEFKVDVNSTKLPMAIKMPIMIAGFGELLSTPVLSNWLFSGISLIIYSILVCCPLKGMRHLCLVYN